MTRLPKNKVSVSVSIGLDLLTELDETAYTRSESRSEFIVDAIKEKIQRINEEKQEFKKMRTILKRAVKKENFIMKFIRTQKQKEELGT